MNDLIPLENPDAPALFRPGGLETILVRIESDARALVPDITTVKGRAAIASTAMKVAKTKTYLDGLGKDLTAELKRQTGAVDAERKAMRDRLDALKAEVRKPLDDWERAEVDRVNGIRLRIADFTSNPFDDQPSAYYSARLLEIESLDVDESFAEFRDQAQEAKDACLYRLSRQRDTAIAREAEAARIESERQAAAAKAQKEREERIAKEAAERATREAEANARAAKEAAERAQAQAEQRAKDAEAKAIKEAAFAKVRQARAVAEERARADAELRAKEEADAKRAADEAHRERIHAEIVDDLIPATVNDRTIAMELCKAIAAGHIRHLTINY